MNACFFAKHLPRSLFSEQPCELGTVTTPIFADEAEAQGDCDLFQGHTASSLSLWALSLFSSPQTVTHELNI